MKSLAAMLHHGVTQNQNKGMDDTVPAMIEGQQPAALSQGEYIVPADVVSMLGDGSTDAGSQILDSLVAKIRTMKQGHSKQAGPVADGLQNLLNPQGK